MKHFSFFFLIFLMISCQHQIEFDSAEIENSYQKYLRANNIDPASVQNFNRGNSLLSLSLDTSVSITDADLRPLTPYNYEAYDREPPAYQFPRAPAPESPTPPPSSSYSPAPVSAPVMTEEQFAQLYQSCSIFQEAKECFLATDGLIGAASCISSWEQPVKTERDKLIAQGFITREEYKALRAEYYQAKDDCKKKSEKASFGSRTKTRYKCTRPHAIKDANQLFNRFGCPQVLS